MKQGGGGSREFEEGASGFCPQPPCLGFSIFSSPLPLGLYSPPLDLCLPLSGSPSPISLAPSLLCLCPLSKSLVPLSDFSPPLCGLCPFLSVSEFLCLLNLCRLSGLLAITLLRPPTPGLKTVHGYFSPVSSRAVNPLFSSQSPLLYHW